MPVSHQIVCPMAAEAKTKTTETLQNSLFHITIPSHPSMMKR
jgi:hypothetical protein